MTHTAGSNGVVPMPARARPLVLKIGGRALEAPGAARELAAEVAAFGAPTVIVHGGGAEVSAWCERLGRPPRFVDGLRVTDPATLEVAVAVLAGLANKRLVASLLAAGVPAVGLAGVDGGMAIARPHADAARLGEVGEIADLDPTLIAALVSVGHVPVIASIAACGERLLNVNADDFAAALAGALGARALVLLSDVPALMLDGAPVARLEGITLEAALAHPDVQGGMRPKLIAARAAAAAGVDRVHIAAWQGRGTLAAILSGAGSGTLLEAPHARPAPTYGPTGRTAAARTATIPPTQEART